MHFACFDWWNGTNISINTFRVFFCQMAIGCVQKMTGHMSRSCRPPKLPFPIPQRIVSALICDGLNNKYSTSNKTQSQFGKTSSTPSCLSTMAPGIYCSLRYSVYMLTAGYFNVRLAWQFSESHFQPLLDVMSTTAYTMVCFAATQDSCLDRC